MTTDEALEEPLTNRTLLRFFYWAAGLVVAGGVAFSCWVTNELLAARDFRLAGDRYTKSEAIKDQREMDAKISALPPPEWKRRVEILETQMQVLTQAANDVRSEIGIVRTIVERIDKKM